MQAECICALSGSISILATKNLLAHNNYKGKKPTALIYHHIYQIKMDLSSIFIVLFMK